MEGKQRNRRREITPELQQAAWLLRDRMTPAEEVLWKALREKQLDGLKFRRQHPVEQFILDFYCPRFKLVVELDGGIHDTRSEEDATRTEHLNTFGYRVIRFRNEEVLRNLPDVLKHIAEAAHAGVPPAPNNGGEG